MESGIRIEVDVSKLLEKSKRALLMLESGPLMQGIGERDLRWVNDNFKSDGRLIGGWKPLSPFTLAHRKHGGHRPLQDSGALRASYIKGRANNIFKVHGDEVTVGTAVPFASFHEKGTGPIFPVNAKILAIPGPGGKLSFLKSTKGIPARPMLPTPSITRDLAIKVIKARVKAIEGG